MGTTSLHARRGFTLIELLLVIGIIAILASIVIVAINPTRQLAQARNAQRRSDVNSLLNAAYQYAIDNNGTLPDSNGTAAGGTAFPTTATNVCANTAGDGPTGCFSLNAALVPTYLTGIPRDPQQTTAGDVATKYYTVVTANNRVTVCSIGEEAPEAADICVTR